MKPSILLKLFPLFTRCLGKLPSRHLLYIAKQLLNENPHQHNGRIYINTFFPPYPSKAFDRFLDSVIQKKRVPYSTYFAVTDKCPFKCPHCSYGFHKKGEMPTDKALNVIKQIKDLGTVTIGFTGGEPLLRHDITELVAAASDDCATIIFTTGYQLTKELALQLKENALGCMMIGIESDDPTEHDKTRAVPGSFTQAIKAIELSLNAGLYTAISTVATPNKITQGHIQKLAELATKYGVHEFRILEPIPTGNLYGHPDEILTNEQSQQLTDFHKRWNKKNQGPAISAFSYLESDQMFGCGAGFHHLFIDAIGNACPCDLTPLSFGNLLEEPLKDIWLRMGTYFPLPRCGCLMKELCTTITPEKNCELPLAKLKSLELCRALAHNEKLPKIYGNLFKNQKPANPPATPQ